MIKRIFLPVTIAALLVSPYALAESAVFKQGVYAGGEVGYSSVRDESTQGVDELVNEFGGAATVIQGAGLYSSRIFAGYKLTENLDVEVGYNQTGQVTANFNGVSGNSVAYYGESKESFSGLDYSILIRPAIATKWNNLFFRLGGHHLNVNNDVSITTAFQTENSTSHASGSGLLYGVGYDNKEFNKDFGVRASFAHFNKLADDSGNLNVLSVGVFKDF